jgi:exonuclease VII small subunit
MNKTLKEIHDLLVAQVDSLSNAIDQTNDNDVAKQLLMEMDEVVHRVNIIQNLLFKQTSAELDNDLNGIKAANDALDKSIQSFKNAADVVAKTTEFLTYVDQAIDLAKTLAVI